MNVARILYPVHVLGPGRRIGIWLAGCSRGCPGCSNPELWEQKPEWNIDIESLLRLIHSVCDYYPVDGFTITGGDPMNQPEALVELLPLLSKIAPDILVYTGYLYEDLNAIQRKALSSATVLIDGAYVDELNTGMALRGSENQRIIYLNEKYRDSYEQFQRDFRGVVENFPIQGGAISLGIHRPDYSRQLKIITEQKGLEEQHHG